MSTRCQIGFYDTAEAPMDQHVGLIYKHSDGYPSGVLPELAPLLADFMKHRGFDAEYMAAQSLFMLVQNHKAALAQYSHEHDYTGFGVCRIFHGDLRYFYRVDPSGVKVYSVTSNNPAEWTLLTTKTSAA